MAGLDLSGRTAVVTGASRGIGPAIARAIAAAGANVVLTARSQEAADAAAAQVKGTAVGVGAHAVDEEAAQRCVDLTLERFGTGQPHAVCAASAQAAGGPVGEVQDPRAARPRGPHPQEGWIHLPGTDLAALRR
ncbi:SDR family NAD(P)-dependent oxidoreductase [Streptomyces sp. NPDC048479]|uniref:SDR family NAD(P)-dependent oxidoreductase n=1 Tax=Streptomyces sp. NPDC048479 TaxID=3154725 RepID=UPI00341E6167